MRQTYHQIAVLSDSFGKLQIWQRHRIAPYQHGATLIIIGREKIKDGNQIPTKTKFCPFTFLNGKWIPDYTTQGISHLKITTF